MISIGVSVKRLDHEFGCGLDPSNTRSLYDRIELAFCENIDCDIK
jgi:hypothetical protein